jgi:DNA mismatch repair protein MutS
MRVQRSDELIDLPQTTRRNLELVQTLRGEDAPTLFSLLDTCLTGMGSRLLKSWLLAPQRDRSQATQRLAAITVLREGTWQTLRSALKGTSDVERITARIALRQVRPRELVALQQSLHKIAAAGRRRCRGWQTARWPPSRPIWSRLKAAQTLLARAILEEPAALVRDGGVIAHGFDAELDELRGHPDQLRRLFARPGNPRTRPHRHCQPAGAVQQGARLLHRGHPGPDRQGARRLPPPPDAEKRRALHHPRAEGL